MELRLILDQETKEALDKIKALLSHRHKNLSMGELVKIIAKETLRKLDPAQRTRKKKPAVSRTPAQETAEPNTRNPPPARESNKPNISDTDKPVVSNKPPPEKSNHPFPASRKSRYISAQIRREVWIRDNGKCSFTDPKTGKRCNSQHRLELDHVEPFALGGDHTLANLRLLCRNHNNWRAERTFGRYWAS
jgi:hypothetical protein